MAYRIAEGGLPKIGGVYDRVRSAMKKFAQVFWERSGVAAIVVTMHTNQHHIWHEDDSPVVLRQPIKPEDLGKAVLKALEATGERVKNLRHARLADAPSFKASGVRTVRKFEESHIAISIMGVDDASFVITIEGEPEKDAELKITTMIALAVGPLEIGEKILQVYQACRDRRF